MKTMNRSLGESEISHPYQTANKRWCHRILWGGNCNGDRWHGDLATSSRNACVRLLVHSTWPFTNPLYTTHSRACCIFCMKVIDSARPDTCLEISSILSATVDIDESSHIHLGRLTGGSKMSVIRAVIFCEINAGSLCSGQSTLDTIAYLLQRFFL